MRPILALTFFCSLALVPIGVGSPIDGTVAKREQLTPGQVWQAAKTFRGGERACVLAIGDNENAGANMEIYIFDQKNVLVASDKGADGLVGDSICCIWYPPRDGAYRIEVRNPGSFVKTCYIALK